MAVPSNTQDSFDTIGNREDLEDRIFMITPTDTPFIASIDAVDAKQSLHEWQIDALAAADGGNAVLEGDDATTDAFTATTRLSNTCQISDKVVRVSGTQQATLAAGRSNELDYQTVKRSLELRRDMETILMSNQAEVTGNSTTARKLGGLESWYTTNDSRGSGGSEGGLGNTAATDSETPRAITETLLRNVVKLAFDAGGDPDTIMLGSFNKQKFSEFTGNATKFKDVIDRRLVTEVAIYESDFGQMRVLPNRFQRSRTGHVLEMDMWAVAYLRRPRQSPLAKTGDSERRQLLAEYTLVSRNEAASGVIADLTTS